MTTYQLVSAGRRLGKAGDLVLALDVRDPEAGSGPRHEVLVWVVDLRDDAEPDRLLAAAVLDSLEEIRTTIAAAAGAEAEGPHPIFVPAGRVLDTALAPGLPSIEAGAVVATIEA